MIIAYMHIIILAIFTENAVRTNILAAVKLIQNRTCIKFKASSLVSFNISIAQKFAVVFSGVGYGYVHAL